jgi:threonine/homoserine/homoserine lactone efflux protein
MSTWFDAVRWAGAIYLVYLGAVALWRLRGTVAREQEIVLPAVRGHWYLQGLAVSLSNPKVILFLGAFLPQFVDVHADPVGQLAVLAVLFVVVLAAVDVATTFAVAKARASFGARQMRFLDGLAGVFLLMGGLALAVMRRP